MVKRKDPPIEIKGAREHNLRDIDLVIPKNQFVVLTGVSGSGKSSLAFDTVYAEGQRRYIESLSSYARSFLGQLKKPDVDHISGLSPSISIEQKTSGGNPRSTVGTITEIHDYLRVLFARAGRAHCTQCDRAIEAQSPDQIVRRILTLPERSTVLLLAPVVRGQKGEFKDLFADLVRRGYVRARVDGEIVRLTDQLGLDRQMRHDVEVVVDRLALSEQVRSRLTEGVEQALRLSEGTILVLPEDNPAGELLLSSLYACPRCGLSFPTPSPQLFSFNSPQGMCTVCDGLGDQYTFDPKLLVPDDTLSILDGAVVTLGSFASMGKWRRHIFEGVAESLGFSLAPPWREMPESARNALLHGAGDRSITYRWRHRGRWHYHGGTWEGIIPQLLARYRKTTSATHRAAHEKFMRILRCPECQGARLNAQARHVRVGGKSIIELEAMSIRGLDEFLGESVWNQLSEVERKIAVELLKEIRGRLGFLLNVGLDYLTLDRPAPSLSGGEAQRIRLASQIGCGLVGVLYVLDEPSIGLHPRDNARLLATLMQLRDQGNTVLVVEHDEETMRRADHLIDFGPGPGVRGGEVVATGSVEDLVAEPRSITGQYLAGRQSIPIPAQRRPVSPPPVVARASVRSSAGPKRAGTKRANRDSSASKQGQRAKKAGEALP